VYEGDTLEVIDHGPGHFPGTALPGQVGNVVVAGHRVTHSRPFRHLDQLQPGDTATFETATGSYTYTFTGHEIVGPYDVYITNQGAEYKATLFACHPPGSARYRIVAYWKLTSPPEPGQPALATG
jgi:sortase A